MSTLVSPSNHVSAPPSERAGGSVMLGSGRLAESTACDLHLAGLTVRPWLDEAAQRLGPQEIRRRLWHMLPGLLPFVFWLIPHSHPLHWVWQGMFALDSLALLWACHKWDGTFTRAGETNCRCSSVTYVATVLTMLLLFPQYPEMGFATLAIIAFGDGSATLLGLLVGGPKLPWNRLKTWAGTLAFLAIAIPMSTLVLWLESSPHVTPLAALQCAGTAAAISAVVESLPMRLNDNLRVGVAAAITVVAMHQLILG